MTAWPDLMNAAFEAGGGVLVFANVRTLYRHKMVRGVDWRVTAFFTAWGAWNLFYYPHLDQWASFVGTAVITAANAAWLTLLCRYRRN